jgi:hypothetical protein
VVCSEQSILDTIPYLLEGARNILRKSILIADFVHQFVGGYEESLSASETELEDLAISICKSSQAIGRICGVNVADVTQDWQTWRSWNGLGHFEDCEWIEK